VVEHHVTFDDPEDVREVLRDGKRRLMESRCRLSSMQARVSFLTEAHILERSVDSAWWTPDGGVRLFGLEIVGTSNVPDGLMVFCGDDGAATVNRFLPGNVVQRVELADVVVPTRDEPVVPVSYERALAIRP